MAAKFLPINVAVAVSTTVTLQHIGIPYGWGDKVDTSASLAVFVAFCKLRGVDCSGYIDWLVRFASREVVQWPEGSIAIGDHLQELSRQGVVEACPYSDCAHHDGALRICGFNHGGQERHVFGVVDTLTLESHGATVGVSRRPYTHPSLLNAVQWCYKVALPETEPVQPKVTPQSTPADDSVRVKFDGAVQLQNADGTLRGSFPNTAGVTSDNRAVILSEAIPRMMQGLHVEYVKPNLIVRQEPRPVVNVEKH